VPATKSVPVTNYRAYFDGACIPLRLRVDLARLSAACPTYNPQHAIQAIRLDTLDGYGAPLVSAAAELRRAVVNDRALEPTADTDELDRRVQRLRRRGRLAPPPGQQRPRRTPVAGTEVYLRDPAVKAWVLQESSGICEACECPGPFPATSGDHFLEVHHVLQLADGGPDTITNAVAVCPNCHRALHLAADRGDRVRAMRARIARLR
jgi:5-methylcytosine-specific restriction protein A